MPSVAAARGASAVARMAWPWRERERNRASATAEQDAGGEDDELHLGDADQPVEEEQAAESARDDAVVAAEAARHQLLEHDGDAEGRQHRVEHVAADEMHDHRLEQHDAERVEQNRRDRHGEQRRQARFGREHGDEAAEHDELALADIDDIGHAPDERHAVGGEREHGADQNAVDQELKPDRRRLVQNEQIADHRPARPLPSSP